MGEFYETYGVDAVMMMQHAGLNKMGQEIRAGCPRRNVQQTIDGLTGAGLTVAVYEEARIGGGGDRGTRIHARPSFWNRRSVPC